MKYINSFLKRNLVWVLSFLVIAAVFAVVFSLYEIQVGAVVYPVVVSLVLMLLIMTGGIFATLKKHRELERMKGLSVKLFSEFPRSSSLIEDDYKEIIAGISRELSALETEKDLRYKDMTEYYTTWAHQIKTPLASMKLKLSDTDTEFARSLAGDLRRVEQYVDMVLTYVRLDSESTDFVFRETDLYGLVRESVKKFSGDFITKKLAFSMDEFDAKVYTDEKWLSFIVEQLLANAVKYTKTGSVEVSFAEDTLSIRDTGIGIDPQDLPRIFDKGYTGFNGRGGSHASGIGLHLCKRISEKLNITISAESKPGVGSCFSLTFQSKGNRR